MRKKFLVSWKRSKQPRKERKYRHNAPIHIRNKFLSVHLSAELRKKYNRRNITLKKGDKVKIVRGQFKGKIGVIEKVDLKKIKVYITGINIVKKDGTKANFPITPSNLVVTDLNIEDKARRKTVERTSKK